MDLERNVSLAAALRYKGQGPMWSFILHRIGGVGMADFHYTPYPGIIHRWQDRGIPQHDLRTLAVSNLYLLLCALPCH